MDLNDILKQKKEKGAALKNRFLLPSKTKFLGLLKLSDKALIKDLRDALIVLPAVFILEMEGVETDKLSENLIVTGKIKPDELLGFDFVVFDENIKNLNKYLELGIVPIAPVKNPLKSVLKEFNPMKNEGNSYLFENTDKWHIFYALVRYLENTKFPFDNKNLTKNVLAV